LATIEAVGEDIAGIIRQSAVARLAIMDIARRDREFFDKSRLRGIVTLTSGQTA
jgi:hypothetical protein